jgi:hypothetical protein
MKALASKDPERQIGVLVTKREWDWNDNNNDTMRVMMHKRQFVILLSMPKYPA